MISPNTLFLKPATWGISPGPATLQSIDEAISAVEMWLTVMPRRPELRPERARMLTLLDVLREANHDTAEADLQSAKLAIKGVVRFVRQREQAMIGAIAYRDRQPSRVAH